VLVVVDAPGLPRIVDCRHARFVLDADVEHPARLRVAIGQHRRHVFGEREVFRAAVIGPCLDAAAGAIVAPHDAEPGRLDLLEEAVLVIVKEAHTAAFRVDGRDQVAAVVMLVAAITDGATAAGDELEALDAALGVTACLHAAAGAVGEAREHSARIVMERDPVVGAVEHGRELVARWVRGAGLEPMDQAVLGVGEVDRASVSAVDSKRADTADAEHHAGLGPVARDRLQERRREDEGAAAQLDRPCERMRPAEPQADVALIREGGVTALQCKDERPHEGQVGLRDRVDTARHRIDRIAGVGAAAPAVSRVRAAAAAPRAAPACALAVAVGVGAAVLAIGALPIAFTLTSPGAATAAIASAAHHEDAGVHAGDGGHIWERCCPCHRNLLDQSAHLSISSSVLHSADTPPPSRLRARVRRAPVTLRLPAFSLSLWRRRFLVDCHCARNGEQAVAWRDDPVMITPSRSCHWDSIDAVVMVEGAQPRHASVQLRLAAKKRKRKVTWPYRSTDCIFVSCGGWRHALAGPRERTSNP
jgi:hypothetical protein